MPKTDRELRQHLLTRDAWTARDVRTWLKLTGLSKYKARTLLGVTAMTMIKFSRDGLTETRQRRTVLAMRYLLEHIKH